MRDLEWGLNDGAILLIFSDESSCERVGRLAAARGDRAGEFVVGDGANDRLPSWQSPRSSSSRLRGGLLLFGCSLTRRLGRVHSHRFHRGRRRSSTRLPDSRYPSRTRRRLVDALQVSQPFSLIRPIISTLLKFLRRSLLHAKPSAHIFRWSLIDLQATEVYDYAVKLANPNQLDVIGVQSSVALQLCKIEYATRLSEYGGFASDTFRYCLEVAKVVWARFADFRSTDILRLCDLADRLGAIFTVF